MKQIEVQIMGASYVLGCKEGAQETLLQAVRMVDEHMCKIRDNGKTKARERVAVLAALNITAELNEQKAQLQTQLHTAKSGSVASDTPNTSTEVATRKVKTNGANAASSLSATTLNTASDAELDHLLDRVDSILGIDTEGRLF